MFLRASSLLLRQTFKRPSHGKLKLTNSCWQTQVGTKTGGKHVCKLLASNRNVFADCLYAVHTHQLEFANLSFPCEGRFSFLPEEDEMITMNNLSRVRNFHRSVDTFCLKRAIHLLFLFMTRISPQLLCNSRYFLF